VYTQPQSPKTQEEKLTELKMEIKLYYFKTSVSLSIMEKNKDTEDSNSTLYNLCSLQNIPPNKNTIYILLKCIWNILKD
jgi:hypothetical protein